MVRIQLHLTAEQDRVLRRMARARRTTRAALIRDAVDRFTVNPERDPLQDLIGSIPPDGGPANISTTYKDVLYGPIRPLRVPRVADRRRR